MLISEGRLATNVCSRGCRLRGTRGLSVLRRDVRIRGRLSHRPSSTCSSFFSRSLTTFPSSSSSVSSSTTFPSPLLWDCENETLPLPMSLMSSGGQGTMANSASGSESAPASSSSSGGGFPTVAADSGAERFSSIYALPLLRKPCFPGYYQILQVQDSEVWDFLIQNKSDPKAMWVAAFLTKEQQVTAEETASLATLRRDAGVVKSVEDLHETGTLLQILNFNPHSTIKGGQMIVLPYKRVKLTGLADPQPEVGLFPANPRPHGDASSSSQHTHTHAAGTGAGAGGGTEGQKPSSSPSSQSGSSSAFGPASSGAAAEGPQQSEQRQTKPQVKEGENEREKAVTEGSEATHTADAMSEEAGQTKTRGGGAGSAGIGEGAPTETGGRLAETSEGGATPIPPPILPRTAPLFYVTIDTFPDQAGVRYDQFGDKHEITAVHQEIIVNMKELLKTSYYYREHFEQVVKFYNLDYPSKLADLVSGMSMGSREELQRVLAEEDLFTRLKLVLQLMKNDLEFARLQLKVNQEVEEKVSKDQRRYMLMEQLKTIKRELGLEKDEKSTIIQSFREALKDKTVPEDINKVIEHELSRLQSLEPSSSEFNVCRTYLEWLTSVPWGVSTEDNVDINKAADILNEDHYGLEDVKDRILEFMAVNILKGQVQGKIMCLVGPPGVGKTSIGQSVARALNRKFYRFSLGGLYDVAELRGHRRTYVGAMPGKMVQALKNTQVDNPVVLLDEVDKMGRDFRGDPSSALLEILDPNQNSTFRDHYLDVPLDLSKILFVCTANTSDTIPAPLLDRMEIIRIAGYVFQEKMKIAEQYLVPNCSRDSGVKEEQIELKGEVLGKLVRDYAREAGVRSLLKLIEKIFRKAALAIVRKEEETVAISLENLPKFVGQPQFHSERLFEETPPGVVRGLAWTQMGGATLYVEATGRAAFVGDEEDGEGEGEGGEDEGGEEEDEEGRQRGRRRLPPPHTSGSEKKSKGKRDRASHATGSFKVTGQLGPVMGESAQIALSFAKRFVREVDPANNYLESHHVHMHVPEGATPKDGPSAGVTMTTALVSLALGKSVIRDLAMTGEMTLTGKVLKVGGIKEKVIAARRENCKLLLFPRDNERDFNELAENICEGLQVHFVDTYRDVFSSAFEGHASESKGSSGESEGKDSTEASEKGGGESDGGASGGGICAARLSASQSGRSGGQAGGGGGGKPPPDYRLSKLFPFKFPGALRLFHSGTSSLSRPR